MGRRSSDELFHRPDEVNPAKCAKRSIHNASHLLVASKFASGTFPSFLMCGQQLPFAGDGFGAAFCHLRSTHRWFSQLMFFEMRDVAAPAFKRTYIGQCAETLRPSISRMFRAQLGHSGSLGSGRSAFMTRLGSARYMRGSIGFLCWSNIHSLLWKRVSTRSKLARKRGPRISR